MSLARRPLAAWVAAIAVLGGPSWADDVTRYSSKIPLRGAIVAENAQAIRIETRQGTQTQEVSVPLNDVLVVNYDGQVGLALRAARNLESSGEYQKALQRYRGAAKEAAGEGLVGAAAEFGVSRVLTMIALREPGRVDEAIEQLEEFRSKHPGSRFHYELHELLGQLYMKKGQHAMGRRAFAELAAAPWEDFGLRALCWEGRMLLEAGNFEEAMAKFEEVAAAPSSTPQAKLGQQDALLLKGECLQKLKRYEEAEGLLRQVIDQTPAEEAQVQARAHNTLGDVLREAGKTKDALLAYLYVELMYSTQREARSKALYYIWQLWKEVGRPDFAAEALQKLKRTNPESPWAKRATEAEAAFK